MDEQLVQWCRRLLACRSVTHEGTRAIAELCARELLAPYGISAELLPSPGEGQAQANLLALVRGREHDGAPLVLNTHLDTVPAGNPAAWSECADGPFAATFKDNRIYGLGAADTKLDFLAKSLALIAGRPPRRDVYLVATFGEEHGLVGAKEIVARGLLPRGALAFVGEPSGLQVITTHKGLMAFQLEAHFGAIHQRDKNAPIYRVVFEGRAAHSSTPRLGQNAIRRAVDEFAARPDLRLLAIGGGDAVNRVPARCEVIFSGERPLSQAAPVAEVPEADLELFPADLARLLSSFIAALSDFADSAGTSEPDYAHPTLTSNAGVIRTVKNSILLEFELRPPPALALDAVRQGVNQITARAASSFPDTELRTAELRANPAFRSTLSDETVELAMSALAAAGLPLNSGVKSGCTEAGVYAAAGLKPVVFGPGPSTGVIHAPNEYNLQSEVEAAVRFYSEILRR